MQKPSKPYEGFPLYAHASGHWAKKIRGKTRFFGRWDKDSSNGWQTALDRFTRERDALYAGRDPTEHGGELTVGDCLDLFLSAKLLQVQAGELNQTTWDDYDTTCSVVAAVFGATRSADSLSAADFEQLRAAFAKRYGPVRLKREITQARMIFRYCFEAGHLTVPVKFGPQFKAPARRAIRTARQANGLRLFEPSELDRLVDAAGVPLRAFVLLGVNCGFGNHDCGQLRFDQVDLEAGWHFMPRPKTGVDRRAKLWPETVDAIRAAIDRRPDGPADLADLVFLTKYRQSWYKSESYDNPISNEFRKLLDELGLYRRGRTFYALRHTFETIAGACRDQVAVDFVMGHLRDDMATIYRQRIEDDRLEVVAETVRKWWQNGKGGV